ncbi:MAG: 4-hydroxy-tetrahydrodipicolinate reductase [Elusimicrobia bacterium]|nr:4-hydroxy-tetrahydrodipicolinate reductase [Elusimicrobiota bacterium]
MPKPLDIVVCGALGRMGSRVTELAARDKRLRVVGRVDKDPAPADGAVLGASRIAEALARADVLVDFSLPEGSVQAVAAAAKAQVAAVVGTTGFTTVQAAQLRSLSRSIPLFLAPNMSPGVNVMVHLCRIACSILGRYELSIAESHHSLKKDAPSGTALSLAKQVQEARGTSEAVPIVAQRMGDIIGEHTLTLAGPHERIEITHRAHSRDVFARGALEASLWIRKQKPGLYGMRDMLRL